MDPKKIDSSRPTIENELRKALFQAGCVIQSNSEDLGKINWSRSSRTDKGVHAARIVFSAKLEVDETTCDHSASVQRFPGIVKAINSYLPKDIRIFSCIRINNGFSARSAGIWREYEYIFPFDMLKTSSATHHLSDDELLKRLNIFLQQLEGCNDFHNFHRMSGREMSRRLSRSSLTKSSRDSVNSDPDSISEAESLLEGSNDCTEEIYEPLEAKIQSEETSVYKYWKETSRVPSLLTRSIIYCCRAIPMDLKGRKFVKVSILGQHFLLQ